MTTEHRAMGHMAGPPSRESSSGLLKLMTRATPASGLSGSGRGWSASPGEGAGPPPGTAMGGGGAAGAWAATCRPEGGSNSSTAIRNASQEQARRQAGDCHRDAFQVGGGVCSWLVGHFLDMSPGGREAAAGLLGKGRLGINLQEPVIQLDGLFPLSQQFVALAGLQQRTDCRVG